MYLIFKLFIRMKKIILELLTILLISCSNNAVKTGFTSQTQNPQQVDSIDSTEDGNEFSNEELFNYNYSNLLKSYNNDQTVDTLFVIGKDSFQITTVYMCLNDGKVLVPKKYLQPYLNKDFFTHNFVIHFVMHKNGTLFIDKKLYKEDFFKYMDKDYDDIKKNCTLLFSGLRLEELNFLIDVSIGVPLTDVGVGLSDTIKTVM